MLDIPGKEKFSLFVGTPSLRGTFCKSYVLSIIDLQNYCLRNDMEFELRIAYGISVVDAARNAIANWFLFNTEATHLFFWDDDMGAVTADIVRMFDYRDRDVVAALYPRKKLNMERVKQAVLQDPDISPAQLMNIAGDFSGMFVPLHKEPVGDVPVQLARAGTGLMMIGRECLMKIVNAGNVVWTPEKAIRGGRVYEFFQTVATESGRIGEDFYFCDLVRNHGGKVWGCPWVRTTHVGPMEVLGNPKAVAMTGMSLL